MVEDTMVEIIDGIAYPVSVHVTLRSNAQGEVSAFDEAMWSLDAYVSNGKAVVGTGTSLASASVDLTNNMRRIRDESSTATE
jgi:hypothetical protein